MELKDILNKNLIVTQLHAENKNEVLKKLVDLLNEEGHLSDPEFFLNAVYERERIGATGIGNYIAIPHGKSSSVIKPGVAVAILSDEVEWESLDETGAKIVVLFAVGDSNDDANDHLKLLAAFSRKLAHDETVNALLQAQEVEDVINTLV